MITTILCCPPKRTPARGPGKIPTDGCSAGQTIPCDLSAEKIWGFRPAGDRPLRGATGTLPPLRETFT